MTNLLGNIDAERARLVLWLPILFGTGISIYFAADVEPDWWIGGVWAAGAAFFITFIRKYPPGYVLGLCLLTMGLGFGAAQLRTYLVEAPVLERIAGDVRVEGRVVEVEALEDDGARITLTDLKIPVEGAEFKKIRVTFKALEQPVPVGSLISFRATLLPPMHPAAPGAFDFARHAFFMQLGATGSALTQPEIIGAGPASLWNHLRQIITDRILLALPPDQSFIAAALITGEQAGIPKPLMAAYRDSGLAHLLSISGVHMSLLAGLVFVAFRGGLALVPVIALRVDIKKVAALVALAATFFYVMLAGSPVPAQRSFLMTGFVLLAVLLDRNALSMRMVAWAAFIVLLIAPESLIGPSFQMSFAAVAALIAAFEYAAPAMNRFRQNHPGLFWTILLYLAGVALSTLVAGTATAVYGVYHFNRFAVWSLLSNAVAVPLTGFIVMPAALVSVLLMPLGLESWPLMVMGQGVDFINQVGIWTANLPYAAISLPPMPGWGIVVFTLGFVWLLIWNRPWRFWGLLVIAIGLLSPFWLAKPDILVDGRGYSFGVQVDDGLLVNRGSSITRQSWERRAGPNSAENWPRKKGGQVGPLNCQGDLCLYGGDVALVLDEGGVDAACRQRPIVISAVPIEECPSATWLVHRFDLWRHGAYAFYLQERRVERVSDYQGDRPWSYQPIPRRKRDIAPDP